MSTTKPIRRVAIIGTGVIGASWAALFLANGLEVVATDIAPNAESALKRFIEAAWPALKRLGLAPGASQSNLSFTADLLAAVKVADLVQENGPKRRDIPPGRPSSRGFRQRRLAVPAHAGWRSPPPPPLRQRSSP